MHRVFLPALTIVIVGIIFTVASGAALALDPRRTNQPEKWTPKTFPGEAFQTKYKQHSLKKPNAERGQNSVKYDFCVVGGGPAGVQLGYFFQRYNLDYVVLEQSAGPGSFFWTYPRQRNLISINKVYTGTNDTEFNLRHDWNSLLNGDDDYFFPSSPSAADSAFEQFLFKNISKQYYPNADTIPMYLEEFLIKNPDLHIVFNTEVARVMRDKKKNTGKNDNNNNNKQSGDFHLFLNQKKKATSTKSAAASVNADDKKNSGAGTTTATRVQCQVVIMATGKSVEKKIKLKEGTHLLTSYTDAPNDADAYKNQEVLILGAGNSAFELARMLESRSALVHIASRNPIQMAHQTHYVGDVRAVNLGFLDRYQLKSMDVLMTLSTPDVSEGRLYLNKTSGKIMLRQGIDSSVGTKHRQHQQQQAVGGGSSDSQEIEAESEDGSVTGNAAEAGRKVASSSSSSSSSSSVPAKTADEVMLAEAAMELFPSRRGYHRVISCLGFKWNSTPFNTAPLSSAVTSEKLLSSASSPSSSSSSCDTSDGKECATLSGNPLAQLQKEIEKEAGQQQLEYVLPFSDAGDAFIEVASNYESVNVPDLFVAGALAHFRDFKRSAGGFIHGFRYTARMLVAQLRERYANGLSATAHHRAAAVVAAATKSEQREPVSTTTEYPFLSLWSRSEVVDRMMYRLKNVSSLYQMQGHLCDVVVINEEDEDEDEKKSNDINNEKAADSLRQRFNNKLAPYWYFQDLPLDQVKSRVPFAVGINAFKRNKKQLRYVTLSLQFGKNFQGVGALFHQAQEETYKRKAEKMLWDTQSATADPDFRLQLHRAGSSNDGGVIKRITEKITQTELMRRDEEAKFRRGVAPSQADDPRFRGVDVRSSKEQQGHYMPAAPQKGALLHPLELPPQNLPPKDGKPSRLDKLLFLHPVLREYRRTPDTSSSSSSPPLLFRNQLIRELPLHEDVLNDFSSNWYFRVPTKKFLDVVLPFA